MTKTETYRKEISALIKGAQKQGILFTELAKVAGVDRVTIYRVLAGKNASTESINKIEKAIKKLGG